MSGFLGEDEWAYRRRPSARHQHSGGVFLDPNAQFRRDPNGLNRTRSTGHAPTPIVNVYNDVYQDANLRADNHSPPFAAPQYPPSPDFRGRRLGDELADEIAEMRLERRMRSRSRGRSDASSSSGHGRSEFYRHELERLEREKRDIEKREEWKKEEARIKGEMEIKRLKDEAKRAADEEARDAEKKRIVEDYERKQREAKEKAKAEEIRVLEKMEREKKEAKEEEKRVMEKIEREKREAKEREDREWAEFERRRKDKLEKEEREKKEAQAKMDDAMRKRLAESGFTQSQIEAIMDKEKKKSTAKTTTTTTTTTTRALAPLRSHVPVYAKIHVDYLSTETLRYYDIPWEYDRNDPSYIIILREMDKHETNILFDHTKALRAGRLLLEAPKEKRPEYAWYRKRDRSKSRTREGEWKKFGILEIKR
ncbi:hypothetical protein Q7P37_001309 [Cladosporium fusiforme]